MRISRRQADAILERLGLGKKLAREEHSPAPRFTCSKCLKPLLRRESVRNVLPGPPLCMNCADEAAPDA